MVGPAAPWSLIGLSPIDAIRLMAGTVWRRGLPGAGVALARSRRW